MGGIESTQYFSSCETGRNQNAKAAKNAKRAKKTGFARQNTVAQGQFKRYGQNHARQASGRPNQIIFASLALFTFFTLQIDDLPNEGLARDRGGSAIKSNQPILRYLRLLRTIIFFFLAIQDIGWFHPKLTLFSTGATG